MISRTRAGRSPIRPVGHQLADVCGRHTTLRGRPLQGARDRAARARAIPDPGPARGPYPFELSGGIASA